MRNLGMLENEGLKLRMSGKYKEAIEVFEEIIAENPNYEWGSCFYMIAGCLESLGQLNKAKEYFLKSLEYDDEDTIRLGNYASFLYLHGNPKEALDYHFKLLHLEKIQGFNFQDTLVVIKTLAEKAGISESELEVIIQEKLK